jgi:hypothetical protein
LTSVPLCFAHHGPEYLPLSENAKVASGVVLHINSYDFHGIGFFYKSELDSLFYSRSFVVSFSSYGRFFPMSDFGRTAISHRTVFLPSITSLSSPLLVEFIQEGEGDTDKSPAFLD